MISPACAKLSLYLSKSYSNKLEEIVEIPEEEGAEQKTELELLIQRIQAIQEELPKHDDPFYEDEKAFSEAAEEHYAMTGIEVYLNNRSNHFEIHLELKNSNYLRDFVTVSRQLGLRIDDIEANQAYVGSGLSVYTITITIFSAELKKYKTHREIIQALSSLDYIYHIEELR